MGHLSSVLIIMPQLFPGWRGEEFTLTSALYFLLTGNSRVARSVGFVVNKGGRSIRCISQFRNELLRIWHVGPGLAISTASCFKRFPNKVLLLVIWVILLQHIESIVLQVELVWLSCTLKIH